MATDIAIVLGFLALAGDRVPPGLKTFLLTLAIVDDIGAIVVIAVFYTGDALDFTALGVACLLFALVYGARRVGLRHPVIYAVLALGAWAATYASGVHATIAGVVLALLTSAKPLRDSRYVDAEALADVSTVEAASETAALARQSVSSVEWLQHLLHPWSSYVVLPLFALANAGIVISADSLRNAVESPVAVGVALGLVFGKPLGVCAMTYFGIRILGTELPSGVHMTHVVLGSLLTGVGFTVALFISDLAFVQAEFAEEAKAGVLVASLVAGILGYTALRFGLRKHQIARS
jgi:Na+/H+ antiporter NhaA